MCFYVIDKIYRKIINFNLMKTFTFQRMDITS